MKKACTGIKGLTLIEIIVSIFILGIIAVTFLPIFTNSFVYVKTAGNRSIVDFDAQKAMENKLAGSSAVFDHVATTESNTTLTIGFNSGTISVQGRIVNISYNDGKHNVTLTTFIPN